MKAVILILGLIAFSGAASAQSAVCADGSYSYSAHRRGTCSRHGGVAQWLSPALPNYAPRYTSRKCEDLEDAQDQLKSATDELESCTTDGDDDCDSQRQDVDDAQDTYQDAVSEADGDCQ